MSSFVNLLGKCVGLSWICEAEQEMGLNCILRKIIDGVCLIFLSIFYVSLLLCLAKKHNLSNNTSNRRIRDWISIIVSILCMIPSIAYFIASMYNFGNAGFSLSPNYLIRSLVWTSFALSLFVQWSDWIRLFNSIWWISSFLLFSMMNIKLLIENKSIRLFDLVTWLPGFLLLFCAFRNLIFSISYHTPDQDNTSSEPLLMKDEDEKENPVLKSGQAGFLSKLTFSWINPLLRLGSKKPLSLENIPHLDSQDVSELAYQKFSHAWEESSTNSGSNSTRNLVLESIIKVHFKENIFIAINVLLRTIAIVVSPLILYGFVRYSNQKEDKNLSEGLLLVMCLILTKIVESLSQRHWFFDSRRSGMRIRSALMVAVYRKQLNLSSLQRKRYSTGEIVNYIAIDAYRMGEFPWWFHTTWSSALQLVLSIGLLFSIVGYGALLGLIPFLICGLANIPFAKMLQKCQTELMIAQDERLRSTSEILNSMKIIKLQSWEEKFKSLIESFRENEFKWLSRIQYKKAHGTILYWLAPSMVSSIVFFGCVSFGAPLNASTIFTVLAALRSMQDPVRVIPEALSIIIQIKVSFDRLNTFLCDNKIKYEEIGRRVNWFKKNPESCIDIKAGDFSWDLESINPTLREVNLQMKRRQKTAVCGPVGAGKSSLLYAILGEIPKLSGNVEVYGSIAYVPQTSWIHSGTIRENILFGKPMEKDRYEEVIKSCALDKDISSFEHGDLTEIGQRGLNMSGGQKQRIQLARAVYNDADIYLLDDPFSAVDAHTAAVLFNDCVMTALDKKTVILVTHQVEFLTEVDNILVIEGGKVIQSGSYEEIVTEGTAFEQLVNAHKDAVTGLGLLDDENRNGSQKVVETIKPEKNSYSNFKENNSKGVQLTEEEEKEIGDVGWKQLQAYISIANGWLLLCLGIMGETSFVALQAASTYWLALAIHIPQINSFTLIGVYSIISFLSAVFVYIRSLLTARLGLKASKAFFSRFTDSIFKAPMLFFDSTPVGRILTRASSDLSVLDLDIPFTAIFVVASSVQLLATIGIMASVTWQVLIVAFLAIISAIKVQGYYLASAREIVRINGTAKAPIMNYAAETSLGVVTIRAFDMADRFFRNFLKLVDTDAELFFHSNAAAEWLVLRTETLQNLTLFVAAFLLVLLPSGSIAPGLVGLSLSYALSLTTTQISFTRWYCSLANCIISVERIKQFMNIPSEPEAVVKDKRPPFSWPVKGRVEFESLKIKYRPNAPLVLKGISCTFREGTRVGVVGRTGSGKTTLISALFRLVEPESGRILIDGIDICSIGLKDLRTQLSIIPQEPTLFRGSVRTNLDPLGLYSDDDIWKVFEKCQLKGIIASLPNMLDSFVSDEGENWSAGQRQLFCLGRVLLRRNRILVLDEATASIDSATDAILQRIIREEFSECTVLTVAHRIPTVIDSDMVMVLSYGNLVEYDEPSKLMEKKQSYFSKLVAEYWSSCRRNSFLVSS